MGSGAPTASSGPAMIVSQKDRKVSLRVKPVSQDAIY